MRESLRFRCEYLPLSVRVSEVSRSRFVVSRMEFSRIELMPESREMESLRRLFSRVSSLNRVVIPSSVMLPDLKFSKQFEKHCTIKLKNGF